VSTIASAALEASTGTGESAAMNGYPGFTLPAPA